MAGKKKTKTSKGRKNKGGSSSKAQKHSSAKNSTRNTNDDRDGNDKNVMNRSPTSPTAAVENSGKTTTEETKPMFIVDARSILQKVHSEDDLVKLEGYLSTHGRYDSATLAAIIPRTANDLFKQEISPEEVIEELLCLRNTGRWKTRNGHVFVDQATYREDVCHNLAHQLVLTALPERFMNFGRRHANDASAGLEEFEGLREQFFDGLVQEFRDLELEEPNLEVYVDKCKLVLEKYCECWAARLDQALFHSKSGTFLRLCPVYKKNDKASKEMMSELAETILLFCNNREQENTEEHLMKAVDGIYRGIHLLNDCVNCWQCGVACDSLTPCKECNVARYCGDNCKLDAWKSGHDMACSTMQHHYRIFQDSLAKVEEAHKTGKLLGIHFHLSPSLDYSAIKQILLRTSQCLKQRKDVPKFSMQSYYVSLAKIARGDWWMFRGPIIPDGTIELDARCFNVLPQLCADEFADCHCTIPGDTPIAHTVEDFLKYYKDTVPYCANEQDRNSMVRQEKLECFEFFRQKYHKYPTAPTDLDEEGGDESTDEDEEIDENAIDGLKGLTISGLESEGFHTKEKPSMILAEVSGNAVEEPNVNGIDDGAMPVGGFS